jgi:Tat protein translocase TatB subunit
MGLGIGFGEILLILVVALIIWGPQRLPEIARTLGKITRSLRKASFDLTSSVTRELEKEQKPQSQPAENPGKKAEKSPSYPGTVSAQKKKSPKNPERQQQENG